MKHPLLFFALLATTIPVCGASLVEGRIYLKNGSVIECVGDDRLQLPKRFGKLTVLRDAFRKTKAKEVFQSGEIDSVVCWHAQSPEHIRKFIPAENPGWMWVYLETPHICVCIYSEKGYGIDSNGGIQVWQRQGTFSQSRTAYYLKKTGEKEFLTVGAANRNAKDVFRERIARYVGDDPELAERIRLSSAIRSKTIQLLRDYDPTKYNTHNVLSLCKNFVTKELPQQFDVQKADQADLLNRSVQFFKEKDSFDMEEFTNEVFAQSEVIDSFNKYKENYEQDRDLEIADSFTISESAVKKQARAFKSVIKLDKNFHIYVHGNRDLIEQGEDEKGKFYKVYYQEES